MNIKTAVDILYGNAVESTTLTFTPNLEEFQPLRAKSIQESLESILATCEALNREIEAIKYTLEKEMPFNLAGQTYKEWARSLPDEPEDGPEPQGNLTWITAADLCMNYSNE